MYLEIEANRWIFLAIGIGLVLVLVIFLSHLEGSRPRPYVSREIKNALSGINFVFSSIPWVITLVIISSIVLGIWYYLYRVVNPPNW
ncbi:MAG: hypothetical protein HQK54_06650 [Oligoflexales bacterium]|nr:hypothetical protein [Oligoflexales bacterium]